MKNNQYLLHALMKQEKTSNSNTSESKCAELGPPPLPPEGSCSSSSKSEMPPVPPPCGHGAVTSEEHEDEVTHELGCQW